MKWKNNKQELTQPRMVKDTLIIIGNGFDIWQGLDTSYENFRKYYFAHRDEIVEELRIPKKQIEYSDGTKEIITDVELIYGNPFDPGTLEEEFWWNFEESLDKIEDQQINAFFGKAKKDLRDMDRAIKNAKKILNKAFCDWVETIEVEKRPPQYRFGENCVIVNFNYTDTVQKRFEVAQGAEYHIHGEATERASIIIGHSSHPELPMEELYRMHGRFRGLYYVHKILYETDKHVQDCIEYLKIFFALQGLMPNEIKNVYVLGHSFGSVDLEYFQFLTDITKTQEKENENDSRFEEPYDPEESFGLRLNYAVKHQEYMLGILKPDKREVEAVIRQFVLEQEARSRYIQKTFTKWLARGIKEKKTKAEQERSMPKLRTEDARWHISCYNEEDKKRVKTVMDAFGYKNYTTYKTIDECLRDFRL